MGKRSVFEGQRGLILSIFLASAFANLLVLTVPFYMLQLFSRVLASGSMPTLTVLAIGAAIALVFFLAFDAIRERLIARLGNRLEAHLGTTVLAVLIQSASATDRRGAQPLIDLHEIRRFLTGPAFTALIDAPWSLIFVAVIFLFHPALGIVALTGMAILFSLGVASELAGRSSDAAAGDAMRKSTSAADEMIRNAEIVRAMGKGPALLDRWQKMSFGALVHSTRAIDRISLFSAMARMVRMGLQIAVLTMGVILVLDGAITPGVMIAASILLGRAAAPVEQSIAGWRALLSAREAHRRLNTLLANFEEAQKQVELPEPQGRLSVESATLVVAGRQSPLLLDVNFELRPGDMLGIVGPSGAGKTTLARCLVGLQPLSRGHVRIDDASLADWPPDQIGRYIGYLPQRVELFDGTIADNIGTMDEGASPAAVIEAAKRAEVHELILDIPGGYNAPVGLRGELLSGGQRQRIGLARAFFGDKRLIVLDEPNANLDPDGEEALARAVANAAGRGAAVVVVTHRLNILRRLSHVAVMNDGRLARFGTAREIVDSAAQPMFTRQAGADPKVATLNGAARRGRWGAERSA